MKRILLFGGTFDPIHHGHLGLLDIVRQKLGLDEVYLIPTKTPPWKTEMAPIEHRLKMIELALPAEGYHVCDFEIQQAGINYTIDTIKYFNHQLPDSELYYLIGSDQAEKFHEWKDVDELSRLAHFIVYARPGYALARQNIEKYHLLVIEGRRFDVSSTLIRSLQCLDLPWEVIAYMLEHDLYFTTKLRSYYDPKRFLHVVSVAKLAYEIAKSNHLDAGKAAVAALLHDIAKNAEHDEAKKMVVASDPTLKDAPAFSVHQFMGALLASRDFGIADEEILDAIRYHATGKPKMKELGQILYAADKIEPLRGFDSKQLIAACMKDYQQGFIDVLRANYEYHTAKGKPFKYYLTAEAMSYYLGGNQ